MSCSNYDTNVTNLIFPSFKIFKRLCTSYDKTNLFIMTISRIFVNSHIYNYIEDCKNDDQYYAHILTFIKCFFLLVIIFDIISIIFIMIKITLN